MVNGDGEMFDHWQDQRVKIEGRLSIPEFPPPEEQTLEGILRGRLIRPVAVDRRNYLDDIQDLEVPVMIHVMSKSRARDMWRSDNEEYRWILGVAGVLGVIWTGCFVGSALLNRTAVGK